MRFVVASTRTLTWMVLFPPTLSNSFSCRTRRSFACKDGAISLISSNKIVPPSANSKRPSLLSVAPVKAPFSCPKNSLSIRVSEIAAQFTRMYGCLANILLRYNSRATSSFPVPFSPVTKTVASVLATLLTKFLSFSIGSLSPTISDDRESLSST